MCSSSAQPSTNSRCPAGPFALQPVPVVGLSGRHIAPNIAFLFNGDDLAIENLKQSQAWSLLPDLVIRLSERLAAVPHPAGWKAPYEIALICRQAQQHDVAFQMLRRALEARFKAIS